MSNVARPLLLAIFAVLVLLPGRAAAQEDRDPIALFNEASDLAEKGQLADAIAIWLIVAEDIPDKYKPVVQVNLGLAFKQLDKLPEAWYHLNVYVKGIKEKDQDALNWIKELEESLKKTHNLVTIQCEPKEARIIMGGGRGAANSYRCPLVWWFKSGRQVLRATAEGHEKRLEMLQVEKAAKNVFTVKLKALPGVEKPVEKPVVADKPKTEPGKGNLWKWGLVGGGGAMVLGGGIMHGLAFSKNSDLMDKYPDGTADNPQPAENKQLYQDAYDEEVQPKLMGAYALYGLGAAAAITGGVLLFLDSGDGGTTSAVTPMYVPGGSGVAWTLTF